MEIFLTILGVVGALIVIWVIALIIDYWGETQL